MNRREKEIQAYATALYEAVIEEAIQALQAVRQRIAEDADLRTLLDDPARDVQEKFEALRRVVPPGTGEAVVKFLGVLVSKQDLGYLDEIVGAVREQVLARGEAPLEAQIVSAVGLTEEERAKLEAKLKGRFGPNLTFSYRVNPGILGGLIIRVGDTLLDYSLRSRLEELRGRIETVV